MRTAALPTKLPSTGTVHRSRPIQFLILFIFHSPGMIAGTTYYNKICRKDKYLPHFLEKRNIKQYIFTKKAKILSKNQQIPQNPLQGSSLPNAERRRLHHALNPQPNQKMDFRQGLPEQQTACRLFPSFGRKMLDNLPKYAIISLYINKMEKDVVYG